LAAALLACLAILLATLWRWEEGYRPRFPLEHSNVAYSIASGTGYSNPFGVSSGPTAWVPPAVPYVYAAGLRLAWALGIDERAPIVGFNLLAAAFAVFLTLRICLAGWGLPARSAFFAAFLGYGILDPDFLVSSGPLTAAGTALLLAGLASAARSPGGRAQWALVFAACALLAVIHPGLALAGALASIAAGLGLARTSSGGPAAFLRSSSFAAVAGIALGAGPWTLRNHAVFHQWIPAKSNGCFELVLSERETDDGVLSEASLLVGHPSTNPRLLADYARLGERGFLEPYRAEAGAILRDEPGRYLDFCLGRLFNAVCLARSPADIEMLSIRLEPSQAARMVGRRLILMCAGAPNFFWAASDVPAPAELALIRSAGVEGAEAVLADWEGAQRRIHSRTEGTAALLAGFAWSGLPTLGCIVGLLAARRTRRRLVPAAAAIYLVALVPNVLITHDLRHQASFALLFAVFAAGAAEALVRSPRGP
jgi:hypothetical protein